MLGKIVLGDIQHIVVATNRLNIHADVLPERHRAQHKVATVAQIEAQGYGDVAGEDRPPRSAERGGARGR